VFFSSKCSLFHNSNVFGSCIIHILYIYSTNTGTEFFKHGIYAPSFINAVCFIILTYLVPVLFTFYIYLFNKYFKHGIYSPFFFFFYEACFIILTYLIPVLFKFEIQGVLKLKKIIPAPKV
jgi:hypothetical protein